MKCHNIYGILETSVYLNPKVSQITRIKVPSVLKSLCFLRRHDILPLSLLFYKYVTLILLKFYVMIKDKQK